MLSLKRATKKIKEKHAEDMKQLTEVYEARLKVSPSPVTTEQSKFLTVALWEWPQCQVWFCRSRGVEWSSLQLEWLKCVHSPEFEWKLCVLHFQAHWNYRYPAFGFIYLLFQLGEMEEIMKLELRKASQKIEKLEEELETVKEDRFRLISKNEKQTLVRTLSLQLTTIFDSHPADFATSSVHLRFRRLKNSGSKYRKTTKSAIEAQEL